LSLNTTLLAKDREAGVKIIKTTAQKPGSELFYKDASDWIQVSDLAGMLEKIK